MSTKEPKGRRNLRVRLLWLSVLVAGLIVVGSAAYWFHTHGAPGSDDGSRRMRALVARLADAYPSPVTAVDLIVWQARPDRSAFQEIRALGRKAVPYLVEGLHDDDFRVRRGCAEMLSVIPAREGVEALIGRIGTGPGPSLSEIQEALHQLTGHSTSIAPGPLWDRDRTAMQRIWSEWWERNKDRLINTDVGIGLLQDDGSVLPLPVERSYPDGEMPYDVACLLRDLSEANAPLREAAARALGEIKNPCAVPALVEALKDKNGLVRRAAALALGSIGRPEAIEALETAFQDEDGLVRGAASEAIAAIRAKMADAGEDRSRGRDTE